MKIDVELRCGCGNTFIWTAREQAFYAEKGFEEPKRCNSCRKLKRAHYDSKNQVESRNRNTDRTHSHSHSDPDMLDEITV